MTTALANLDKARHALAAAKSLHEIKQIRDIAMAAAAYAKAANLSQESLDYASEIKLEAEVKAGELLQQLERNQRGGIGGSKPATVAGLKEYKKTLEKEKISERKAQHWQEAARIPAQQRQEYVKEAKENGEAPTLTGLINHHKKVLPAAPRKEDKWDDGEELDLSLQNTLSLLKIFKFKDINDSRKKRVLENAKKVKILLDGLIENA